jgi:hypothetical protein
MDTPLTLVMPSTTEPEPKPIVRTWRELPVTEDMLFRGTDERGRSGWFVRLTVGGMFPRRVGPTGPNQTRATCSKILWRMCIWSCFSV